MWVNYNPIVAWINYPECKPLLKCFRTLSNQQTPDQLYKECKTEVLRARFFWTKDTKWISEYQEESQEKKDWMSLVKFISLYK